jgi:predicted transcriptional regulator of viral defense system
VTIAPHEARDFGLSKSGLYRAAKAGRYDRIARGLYLAADAGAADWDWLEAASRRSDATICLTSALAHHDLTDDIPDALHVALPRGARIPATNSAIRWHLFDRATFRLGRVDISIPGSTQTIGIYSPERCIADAFRLRGELGYELGRDALREWLRRGGKPASLTPFAAQLPRSRKPLLDALQVMA